MTEKKISAYTQPSILNPDLAMVFPGQGSQTVGMLKELAEIFPVVQETYAKASAILGYDLWRLVQEGPESTLNQTEKTQPALLVGSVAIWTIWQEQGGSLPSMMAGHSLGEYSALVCAESLNFKDAVQLVEMRGRFMQQAVPEGIGAMAAIVGLSDDKIDELCQRAAEKEILTPANYNAIGQVVVAGEVKAVERLMALAKTAGAKIAKQLPMSVPSHCALMVSAANQLAQYIENIEIKKPVIPVLQNTDVQMHADPQAIKTALIKQLYSPVRWVETIQQFEQKGVSIVIECGPGKVLTGLNKRISNQQQAAATSLPTSLQEALNLANNVSSSG